MTFSLKQEDVVVAVVQVGDREADFAETFCSDE
jgi:hypothetical protein